MTVSIWTVPTILSFCAGCGALLRPGEGAKAIDEGRDAHCENCGEVVTQRHQRIEGNFLPYEAAKLEQISFGELP